MIFKANDLHEYLQSLSPARISQKKNNFNETNFERGRNRKMPNRKSQQSQSAPDNGKGLAGLGSMVHGVHDRPI